MDNEFEKMIDKMFEEKPRENLSVDESVENISGLYFKMYKALRARGFTKKQAFELLLIIIPSIG